MKNNSYDQFFKKAQTVKRDGDVGPKDQVRFSLSSRKVTETPKAKSKPETRTAADNERRLRQSFKMKTAPKRTVLPWKAVGGLVVTLAVAGFYLAAPERVEKLVGRIEVGAFGQAEAADKAAEKPAEKSSSPQVRSEKAAGAAAGEDKDKSPEEKGKASEDLSHYEKLKQRKEELDAREKELAELEEELQRQKVELDKRLQQLEDTRNQIAKTLKDRVEVDQEKVTKLVDLYSNMKPKQAADVIGTINEDLAVEVLSKMKKKNAAEIMNLLPAEKSRVLSEKYTGYRRGLAGN